MKELSQHLSWIEDTCSVYLVRDGDAGLLIDCGTDFLPGGLEHSAVRQVERLMLTHFHRDQCSTASAWQERGTEVVIPFSEKRFLETADLSRASYDGFDNYTSFYPCFAPLRDTVPDRYAHDYDHLEWHGIPFEVVPLPGHTLGSVGYLFQVDGMRVLACGDLMSSPDKIRDYYPVQWRYMEFQGHANLLESLKSVASLDVDLILPGHGEPFVPTKEGMNSLRQKLERLYELFHAHPYPYYEPRFRQLSQHVYEVTNSGANTYIVKDDQGHALFIDCGYTATEPIAANPHRFIDNLTPYLEGELGITQVEWFLPSHYHDDHLAGYSALKRRYGTRMASSPEVKDILEHPEHYDMPCLIPEGLKVDRVIERGESFMWRGVRFFMEQHPGQTLYHHLTWFEVDGMKFLSIGDNISGICFAEQRDYIHSFIPKNRTPVSSYREMAQQILDLSPDMLLTGHGGAVPFDRPKVERWRDWMNEWCTLFAQVLDQPDPTLGMDPNWVEFYPYQVRIQPGERVTFRLLVTNHESGARSCAVRFRSVEGVALSPQEVVLKVAGGAKAQTEVSATFPSTFQSHSLPILADVTWNGRRLGEIAEAVAYW